MKTLLVIVGPTAVGKTNLAIQVAQTLNCPIISCDSRQFYQEMTIGTAKPTPEERAAAMHYFVDSHSIKNPINANDFEQLALQQLDQIYMESDVAIMVGGSGLYVKALCEGFDPIPEIDRSIRSTLNEECEAKGLETLLEELQQSDPEYFSEVDRKNPQRVIRALEVIRGTGKPYSSFRKATKANRPFRIVKFGLEMDRDQLYRRIDHRMDLMLSSGLVEEVKSLYPFKELNALQTVGYQEIFRFIDGEYDWDECVRLLKRNSRRYAKRQLTWFKRDSETQWINLSHTTLTEAADQICSSLD